MPIPILSLLRELSPGPRRFLWFLTANVLSWQCIVGPAMILYGRSIGMPAAWVGCLIASMPLASLLVIGTVPLVTRLGPKRLMLATWLARCLIASAVFLTPWAIARGGAVAGGCVVTAATLGFCLIRAAGVGAWFPWLHEILPPAQRGPYFAADTSITQLTTVVVLIGQGLILHNNPGTAQFFTIYGIGIVAGVLSVVFLARVPGGHAAPRELHAAAGRGAYRIPLADRAFMRFMVLTVASYSSVTWMTASLVLFMRDALHLPSRTIMLVTGLGSFGVLLTIRAWGRFAEHSGSGRAMRKTLVGHSLAASAGLLLLPGAAWTIYLLPVVVVLATTFNSACSMAAHRALLTFVQEEGRIGYTNIWIAANATALGVTPILAGLSIDGFGLNGFRACFAAATMLGLIGAVAAPSIVRDNAEGVSPAMARLLDPLAPIRTLARIAWITAGLHESNRRPSDPR